MVVFSPLMWKILGLPRVLRANVARVTALRTFQIRSVFIPDFKHPNILHTSDEHSRSNFISGVYHSPIPYFEVNLKKILIVFLHFGDVFREDSDEIVTEF